METLWNNLKQGLKNYCDKNGFKKVILGLSGGLDSAICAILAADVLGGKNVTAIMMKTKYTSDLSLKIAREISKQNNLNYHEIDIDPFFEHETDLLKNAFKEDVKGIVQENLQARIRGQILMAWSNQFGGLVLACGNKSEVLTGYCTLYGDTCGGLAPIGNVYKTTIFELAKWRNTLSKALPQEVITRAPSAELAEGQKDENTLPPYSVLDPILKELYDNKQTIEQTVSKGFDKQTVERVQNLITRSAFKRKQMAEMIEI
ncbi:MAG: NAD(+) synthase [Alphaproteobacteria bacterium]|nr:NAD(+) synthase [Alphaproteobacteria bacterium]